MASLLKVIISPFHSVQEIPSDCDIAVDERSNPGSFALNVTKQLLSLHS